MDKLIITCCVNDPINYRNIKDLNMPITVREVADSAKEACDAGAAIVHVHEPFISKTQGHHGFQTKIWLEIRELIRQETELIFQHGVGGLPYFMPENQSPPFTPEEREQKFDIGIEKPDMVSITANPVQLPVGPPDGIHISNKRSELEIWMDKCRRAGVKPEFEVWNVGAYWNINNLIEKNLIDAPYWVTFFLGGSCGVGSPPTIDELLHRMKYIPKGALWELAVWCSIKGIANTKQQLALHTQAITLGGHVRIGMEDNPYYWDGEPAKSNAQLVERIVRIARELGREVASPDEARHILGLPKRT